MRVLLVLFEANATHVSAPTGASAPALAAFDRALQRAGVLLTHGRFARDLPDGGFTFAGGRAHSQHEPPTGDEDASPASGPTSSPTIEASAFWLLQVASRDAALAWAARCPAGAGDRLAVWPVQDGLHEPLPA